MSSIEDSFYGSDKLFTLKDASDAARMQHVLSNELPLFASGGARLLGVEVEVLRRRKQRCVLRYRMTVEDGAGRRIWPVIGKVYKADQGEAVTDLMRRLWEQGFDRDAADTVAIPEVVAYLPRLALLLQEEIGGEPVKNALGTPQAETALRQMAVSLAKLHRTPLQWGEPFTMHDHLRRCHPRPQVLRDRCPELRGAVDEILAEAVRLEQAYGSAPALIHGDFHMGQVHTAPGRTWMIDFDACCVADPAADLGNVLVFLKGKARKFPDAPQLADAFLDSYFQHMPSEVLSRVPLFEAITHLRRACKRMRFQEDGWQKKARRFIDESLESLAAARG
jgi:aminoglycoside phosphotransferase (APT) family kinase protein